MQERRNDSNRGTAFPVRSVHGCYHQDKSRVSRGRVLVAETRGQFRNPEEGDYSPLKTDTRGLVKTQQVEKTQVSAVVNCKVFRTVTS
jgi:hypothetical protein